MAMTRKSERPCPTCKKPAPDPREPKPRFGYGSDYEAGTKEARTEPSPKKASASVSVDPATSVQFLPVRQNRTYYPRVPYYGYSSNPYFYRPGTAGRYYLHSPGCYSGGFTGGTSVNVYHGGSLTFSSWNPLFGYRYYR